MTRPPSVLVQRLGRDNADRLCALVGGTRLSIPGQPRNMGRLVELVGEPLAVLLVFHFGDSRIAVPLTNEGPGGRRTAVDVEQIRRLARRGWSSARIARALGCCERTVDAKRALLRSRAPSVTPKSGKQGSPRP